MSDDELFDLYLQENTTIIASLRAIYEKGKAAGRTDAIDECIKKLAESEDTMLSDRQYYTLEQLKEQK